jgi:WD40 repeat protein
MTMDNPEELYTRFSSPEPGHSDGINCLAFSPSGKYLASGAQDGLLLIWDLNGKVVHRIEVGSPVLCLSWDPRGSGKLAYGSQDHGAAVIDDLAAAVGFSPHHSSWLTLL